MDNEKVYAKYPEWWKKTPEVDQDHQHISEELVHRFLVGEFNEMEEETECCVKMFAGCKECWWKWKREYNSLLSGELSTIGYGSIEYGGSEKKFQ